MNTDILKNAYPFWEALTSSEQQLMVTSVQKRQFLKGDNLRTDLECEGALILLSGLLRVYILSAEGKDVTLFRIQAGENCVLSASCVLDTIVFDMVIEAVEEAEALVIPAKVFRTIMQSNMQVALYAYQHATERFSDVMWKMQQILFLGVDQRLAIFLWDEMIRQGQPSFSVTHEEIARNIGSAREVVSKVMKYFLEEGIAKTSRGRVEILDKDKLQALAKAPM